MFLWRWLVGEDALTKKLRDYTVKNVKIAEADMARSRKLVKDYVENQIMAYCRQIELHTSNTETGVHR